MMSPPVRIAYTAIWEPKAKEETHTPKYSCFMILPKSGDPAVEKFIEDFKAACNKILTEEYGTDKKKWPKKLWNPLRDPEAEWDDIAEAFEDAFYIRPKSAKMPGVVDAQVQPIVNHSEIYSGCYARISITLFHFDNESKGITLSLNNIMKTGDGEAIGGAVSAENEFSEFAGQAQASTAKATTDDGF